MVGMGFTREEVRDSLVSQKYNEVTATYLLLARKNEVGSFICFVCLSIRLLLVYELHSHGYSSDSVYFILKKLMYSAK